MRVTAKLCAHRHDWNRIITEEVEILDSFMDDIEYSVAVRDDGELILIYQDFNDGWRESFQSRLERFPV